MEETHSEYLAVLAFAATGCIFLAATFGISRFLRPHKPDASKLSTYECGEEAVGNGQVQFNSRFFVIALIFVLFEVELLFFFPWAIVASNKKMIHEVGGYWPFIVLSELLVFVLVLGLGLAYAWAKGHLDWIKPETKPTGITYKIPMDAYKNFI